MAAAYGLLVGMLVHRTIGFGDLYEIFRDATETSAVIMIVMALAGIFAYSVNTLGLADPLVKAVQASGIGSASAGAPASARAAGYRLPARKASPHTNCSRRQASNTAAIGQMTNCRGSSTTASSTCR